jgi:transposase
VIRRRRLPADLITDPAKMCEALVGLPDVDVLGVLDAPVAQIHVESKAARPQCPDCGADAHLKDTRPVTLVDLPCFGRPTRLVWHKHRWRCPEVTCMRGSWTEEDPRIASPRMAMSDRAARWATAQVGCCARSVYEVARELGCDWHTVNDAVVAYGEALVDDPGRFGAVEALGMDEALMVRRGPFHRQEFSTQIVDVASGQLLDVVPGRSSAEPMAWLAERGRTWRSEVHYATLDLSGPYRKVFTLMVPGAIQVADPFHVVKVRHEAPCLRRRVRDPPLRAVAAVR